MGLVPIHCTSLMLLAGRRRAIEVLGPDYLTLRSWEVAWAMLNCLHSFRRCGVQSSRLEAARAVNQSIGPFRLSLYSGHDWLLLKNTALLCPQTSLQYHSSAEVKLKPRRRLATDPEPAGIPACSSKNSLLGSSV